MLKSQETLKTDNLASLDDNMSLFELYWTIYDSKHKLNTFFLKTRLIEEKWNQMIPILEDFQPNSFMEKSTWTCVWPHPAPPHSANACIIKSTA